MQTLVLTLLQPSLLEKMPAEESANYLVHLVGEARLVLKWVENMLKLEKREEKLSTGWPISWIVGLTLILTVPPSAWFLMGQGEVSRFG